MTLLRICIQLKHFYSDICSLLSPNCSFNLHIVLSCTPFAFEQAEGLHSDRQLRPRIHRRTQTATVQRSDGEEEDLSETRRRPVRTFRIESDPEMYEDEQQDGFVTVSLVDLVKHMHPYSLRVAMDKKESLRDVEELQEEDVFVDVVGDDDTQETSLGMPVASTLSNTSDLGSEQIVPHAQSPTVHSAVHNSKVCQEDMLKMCSPNSGEQKEEDTAQRILANSGSSGRMKKKVRFAPDLASIHMYQVEDEAHECDVLDASTSADHTGDLQMADWDSQTSALSGNLNEVAKEPPSQNGNAKLKTLSLQEYRLLRQKKLPKEERKTDYRTKWPSVPETPKELSPIPCIPGYNSSQVNVQNPSSNAETSTLGAVAKSRRNLHLPVKSLSKQNALIRKPVQAVDPPNPVTVSLQPHAKILSPLSEEQKVMQQEIGKSQAIQTNLNHPAAVQDSDIRKQPSSVAQVQPSMVSPEDSQSAKVKQTKCSLTMSGIVKTNIAAPSSPVSVIPVHGSQESLPLVQIPVSNQSAEEKRQESTGEIGNFSRLVVQ